MLPFPNRRYRGTLDNGTLPAKYQHTHPQLGYHFHPVQPVPCISNRQNQSFHLQK